MSLRTYGAQGLWDWGYFGPANYSSGMAKPSSTDMSHLKNLLSIDSYSWVPEHGRILNQPTDNALKMVLVRTWRQDVYVYMPNNTFVELDLDGLGLDIAPVYWYDPTAGAYQLGTKTSLGFGRYRFHRPSSPNASGEQDWVLFVDGLLK